MKIGDQLKDNDPRVGKRILNIIHVSNTHVKAETGKRTVEIAINRIFNDGKPRRSGFDLVVKA